MVRREEKSSFGTSCEFQSRAERAWRHDRENHGRFDIDLLAGTRRPSARLPAECVQLYGRGTCQAGLYEHTCKFIPNAYITAPDTGGRRRHAAPRIIQAREMTHSRMHARAPAGDVQAACSHEALAARTTRRDAAAPHKRPEEGGNKKALQSCVSGLFVILLGAALAEGAAALLSSGRWRARPERGGRRGHSAIARLSLPPPAAFATTPAADVGSTSAACHTPCRKAGRAFTKVTANQAAGRRHLCCSAPPRPAGLLPALEQT